jgi:hypothetical protein
MKPANLMKSPNLMKPANLTKSTWNNTCGDWGNLTQH